VREVLVQQQQAMAKRQGVVMEGRDIGTRVLVNAPLKIFMSASVEKRVKWKRAQMKAQGQVLPMKSVREALLKRDRREMKRKVDPLRPAKGAWRLDTSELSIEEVVERIVERVKKL
jgi:cytidylate kinase